MSEILPPVRVPPLVSPRTVKFIEAMNREGDSFDFNRWLKRVREEEAQAKQAPTSIPASDLVAARVDNPVNTSGMRDARISLGPALISKPALNPTALCRRHQEAQSQTPNARLRRRFEKIHRASGEFQTSRRRDAIYEFLATVYAIVMHYKVRRRTTRLIRHAFKFADRPFDKNADPFTAVIRCTSERDIDNKTVSKYARALRYAACCKKPDTELREFMKKAGGVNRCADRYAKLRQR